MVGTLNIDERRNIKMYPILTPIEEAKRIQVLKDQLAGKDTTIEPYSSMRDELEWYRTDSKVLKWK